MNRTFTKILRRSGAHCRGTAATVQGQRRVGTCSVAEPLTC
jgi:hypothetical protein